MVFNQGRCSLTVRKPAHRGVLLPEFGSRVLEVLRQPMEDRLGAISRAQGSLTFPANFL